MVNSLISPKVSVIMPVYNAEKYLVDSIYSILNQSFDNFEFIIVNDGSIDSSHEIILQINDSRIRYFNLEDNQGIVNALNLAIDNSIGQYIARMDADDIAHPNRLEKQVEFMDLNPEIGISGTNVKYFGNVNFVSNFPLTDKELKAKLLFHSPFVHPSIIAQAIIFKSWPYVRNYPHMEDYFQWFRLMNITKFAIIPDCLLDYRDHSQSISKVNSFKESDYLILIYYEIIKDIIPDVNFEEVKLHLFTKIDFFEDPSNKIEFLLEWFLKLKAGIYEQNKFPIKETINEINTHLERMFYRLVKFNKYKALKFILKSGVKLRFKHFYYLLKTKSIPQ